MTAAKRKEIVQDDSGISNKDLIQHWVPLIKRMESGEDANGNRQAKFFWSGRSAVEFLWRWEKGLMADCADAGRVAELMRRRLIDALDDREKEVMLRRRNNKFGSEVSK